MRFSRNYLVAAGLLVLVSASPACGHDASNQSSVAAAQGVPQDASEGVSAEKSLRFWKTFSLGDSAFEVQYSSVEQFVEASDAIVVGRVTGVDLYEIKKVTRHFYFALAELTVSNSRVLKGEMEPGQTFEFVLTIPSLASKQDADSRIKQLQETLDQGQEVLFFLQRNIYFPGKWALVNTTGLWVDDPANHRVIAPISWDEQQYINAATDRAGLHSLADLEDQVTKVVAGR